MVETTPENSSRAEEPSSDRRSRRQRRRRSRRSRGERSHNERSLVNFSALHITVGVIAACLQMVHFTNNSILSQPQPGLWCGTFFIVTGAVCLALSKTRGLYSTLVMLAFCLVSLFMALTLASLSWLGSEASIICEESSLSCNSTNPEYYDEQTHHVSNYHRKHECDSDNDGKFDCEDLSEGCCGYNINLGRTIHSMLMLVGILEATTSFILAAVACSRSSSQPRRRYPSFLYAVDDTTQPGTHARPVTAWDYPPPEKQTIFTVDTESNQLPDEPPPPYDLNGNGAEEQARF